MHGVKRANGLHWEGAGDSREHRVSHTDEVATPCEHLEPTRRGAFVSLAQPPGGAPPEDGAGRFGKRQRRRDPPTLRAYRRPGRHITLQ